MKTGTDRRRHLRIPLTLHVVLMTPQGAIKGKTADISVSGLAILLFLNKPKIGSEFPIILQSSKNHEMPIICEKIWSGKFISDDAAYNAIGVRFVSISSSDRDIIASMGEDFYLV